MSETPPLTLRQYYGSFKSIWGALAGVSTLVPFLSKLLPESLSSYVFPPLGNVDGPARTGTFVLTIAATYAAFFWAAIAPKSNARRVVASMGLAVAFYCLYLLAYSSFVRTIDIPTRGTAISVSIGYERSAFASSTFRDLNDWELLRARGTDEEEIRRLWTARSLLLARGSLFLTYLGFALCLVFSFSWGVLYQMSRVRG